MAKQRTGSNDNLLDLSVNFGNVGAGDKTARIGVQLSRSLLSLAKAEKQFCEKRLTCCLSMSADGAPPEQGHLNGIEVEDVQLTAAFDVKSVRFTSDDFSFGLTAMLGSIDVGKLAQFAKKQGRLIVQQVEAIPEEDRKKAASGEKEVEDE